MKTILFWLCAVVLLFKIGDWVFSLIKVWRTLNQVTEFARQRRAESEAWGCE